MKPLRHRLAICSALALLPLLVSGCALMAASGELNDSTERTRAKDQEERMARIRESGSLRPGEYDALRDKMGDGRSVEVAPKPSTAELRQRVEANRRRTAPQEGDAASEEK